MDNTITKEQKYTKLIEITYHVMKYVLALTVLTTFISVVKSPKSFLYNITLLLIVSSGYILLITKVKEN